MKSGPQVLLAFWSVAVIFWSRVFFSARVALSLDGERAEPLANMLFGIYIKYKFAIDFFVLI